MNISLIFLVIALITLAIDAWQTMQIKRYPTLFEENKLLGSHPSDERIIIYMCASAMLLILVTQLIEPLWWISFPVIVLEAICIINNYHLQKSAKRG